MGVALYDLRTVLYDLGASCSCFLIIFVVYDIINLCVNRKKDFNYEIQISNSKFSIMFENSKGLLVKETILLNMLRSVCAGLVIMTLLLFMSYNGSVSYIKFFLPVVFPLLALISVATGQLLSRMYLGVVGKFLCMVFTVVGDPLVFVLFKLSPRLFPVKDLRVFNIVCLILVYNDNVPEYIRSSSNEYEKLSCPYVGRIAANTDRKVLGFIWPKRGTIFIIDSDWNVTSRGMHYGWIDIAGQIRKGLKGNPIETLSPGRVIGSIESDILYIDDIEIGKLEKMIESPIRTDAVMD